MAKKLTPKQELFVSEYLVDLNATQAAIRAGYSAKTASEQGYQLLQKNSVSEAIARAMAKRSKRTGVNADRVIEELAKIAFASLPDVVDPATGKIKENATAEDLAAIQSIKIKESTGKDGFVEREVKMAGKMDALKLLGDHLKMWDDKPEVNVTVPVVITGEDMLED